MKMLFSPLERLFELADFQYREGALDFISVLDAQRTLLEVETELSRSKEEVALSLVGIYKAFGSGWEAFELVDTDEPFEQVLPKGEEQEEAE